MGLGWGGVVLADIAGLAAAGKLAGEGILMGLGWGGVLRDVVEWWFNAVGGV